MSKSYLNLIVLTSYRHRVLRVFQYESFLSGKALMLRVMSPEVQQGTGHNPELVPYLRFSELVQ
jgi:hypothetical protein